MKDLLIQHDGYAEEAMKLLLDKDATCEGIQNGLERLAQGGDDRAPVRVFIPIMAARWRTEMARSPMA